MTSWLYRYEIKGIQEFVLATGRLKEMAGASALIEQLPERLENAKGAGEVLMSAAGAATVRFATTDGLRELAEWWPMVVDAALPGTELVQAWIEEEGENGLERLAEALRSERNRRFPDLPEAGPPAERSGRTGRPAVSEDAQKGGLVDRPTQAKISERAQKRDRLSEKLLLEDLRRFVFITNHEDFGDETIAVIHIDGNDMGRRVLGRKWDPESYRRFSQAVTEATLEAARSALRKLVERSLKDNGDHARSNTLPARPIVLGGDDFTIITRARDAIPFMKDYLNIFEKETNDRCEHLGGSGLTACAGAAFIKPSAPFHDGYRLSEELCSEAKARLRGRGSNQTTPSGLMFHRVTSPMIASLREIAGTELAAARPDGTASPWALSYGPYTLGPVEGFAPIEKLGQLRAAASRLPRGALREWLRAAQIDPPRAEMLWKRLAEVAKKKNEAGWKQFAKSLEDVRASADSGWARKRANEGFRRTPLGDVISWSMVAGKEGL